MNQQQRMEDLVGRYVEAFNQQDVDALGRVLAQNFIDHTPLLSGLPSGREGARSFAKQLMAAFPDLWGSIEDTVTESDAVVARIRWTGTQQGRFSDLPASGRTVSITAIHMMKACEGEIVEHWAGVDQHEVRRQLGTSVDNPAVAPHA